MGTRSSGRRGRNNIRKLNLITITLDGGINDKKIFAEHAALRSVDLRRNTGAAIIRG